MQNTGEKVENEELNRQLLHQLVRFYIEYSHTGTKRQKTRSEVNGGGQKPWRQKGTGRARSGSSRSPIWRTGGKVFAARSCESIRKIKLNKKMYREAVNNLVVYMKESGKIVVIKSLINTSLKTREIYKSLNLEKGSKTVIIDSVFNPNVNISLRNLHNVSYQVVSGLNPLALINANSVLITEDALQRLNEF